MKELQIRLSYAEEMRLKELRKKTAPTIQKMRRWEKEGGSLEISQKEETQLDLLRGLAIKQLLAIVVSPGAEIAAQESDQQYLYDGCCALLSCILGANNSAAANAVYVIDKQVDAAIKRFIDEVKPDDAVVGMD